MKISLAILAVLALSGCAGSSTEPAAPASTGMIPVTTTSTDARARFDRGVELLDNLRTPEAAAEFSAARQADPGFVQARAYQGQALPGAEGLAEIEGAAAGAAGLPEAERVLIEAMLANRQGDIAKTRELSARLTQLAPNDARAHYFAGFRQLNDRDYGAAAAALRRATELNPKAGGAQNMLGYAALRQGDTDAAVAAFTAYATMLPTEPNPQDSLGEALLAAGKFPEAEAAFRKALELSPQFWNAWDGIAYTKLFAGDAAGLQEALTKAREGAPRPVDKVAVELVAAAAAVARGNIAEAQKILAAAETLPNTQPADTALLAVFRAGNMVDSGRAKEALAPLAAALQRAEAGQLPPGAARNLRREALRARIAAETRLNDAAAAEKTSAMLDQDAASRAEDPLAQSAMHYGRGMLALAKADVAGARGHFEQCVSDDEFCKWQGVQAAEKAGDAAGAAAGRAALTKLYVRDPVHIMVRSRLTAKR